MEEIKKDVNNEKIDIETLFVHAGYLVDKETGAVAPPLIRTKTYRQPEFGKEAKWQYSRGQNPTREILEDKLAKLEGDANAKASVFSSGLAAETMFFLTLNAGEHVLFVDEVYGGTFRLLTDVFAKLGIEFDFTSFESAENIKEHIKPNTKYLFVENPTNPSLKIIDLALVKKVSEETGIPYVADMTFSPPYTTRAFEYGAETIIHSISKYLSGHNDVIGGAVITKNPELNEKLKFLQRAVGAILSPDECYRAIQGLKTLHLRWKYASNSAQAIAECLLKHPKITRVLYPGIKEHLGHEIAKKQMKNGFGAVVSFETNCQDLNKLKKFVDKVQERGNILYGESLASPETILSYPPLMSHHALPKEERLSLGISDGFFRLSLGFENVNDILYDLERGLELI